MYLPHQNRDLIYQKRKSGGETGKRGYRQGRILLFFCFGGRFRCIFYCRFLDSIFFGASFFSGVFFVIAISSVQLLSQVLILNRDVKSGLSGPVVCIEGISGSPVILIIPEQMLGPFVIKLF